MIRCFIFDWGSVLCGSDSQTSVEYICNKHPSFSKELVSKVYKDVQYEAAASNDYYYAIDLISQGVGIDRAEVIQSFNRNTLTPTFEYAKKLKERGFGVCLFSNQIPLRCNFIRENYDLSFFDTVIFSNEIQLKKPDKEAYEYLLEHINFAASECVFVDDRQKNIDMGEAFGIKGIHYTNHEDFLSQVKALGMEI